MNTRADKIQKNKSRSIATAATQKQGGGESTFQFFDEQPEAVAKRKLQEIATNSLQARQANQLQTMTNNYFAQQRSPIQKKENNKSVPHTTDTTQLMRDGRALRGPTGAGTAHPTLNNANYAFATLDPSGQRTPSLYFNTPAGHVRMRTQHDHGPALTTPTNNGQFFFHSRNALRHWRAHIEGGGTNANYPGYVDPTTGSTTHPSTTPVHGWHHAEIRADGTVHTSGGLTHTGALTASDHELNDMTQAITTNRATYRNDPNVSAMQLKRKISE